MLAPRQLTPPDHLALLSHLLDLSVSQLSSLLPMHSNDRFLTDLREPLGASVTL
jgi:hypothetical protein